jgi:hypothetical protein
MAELVTCGENVPRSFEALGNYGRRLLQWCKLSKVLATTSLWTDMTNKVIMPFKEPYPTKIHYSKITQGKSHQRTS